MRNVGGPVVFALFLVFLIFDIRRAPPDGKLCEFVPRRSVAALDDFITEILLQLSGRYGDGYPRVLARSARCVRCERHGKKDEGDGEPSPSCSFVSQLLKKRRAAAGCRGGKVDSARL